MMKQTPEVTVHWPPILDKMTDSSTVSISVCIMGSLRCLRLLLKSYFDEKIKFEFCAKMIYV